MTEAVGEQIVATGHLVMRTRSPQERAAVPGILCVDAVTGVVRGPCVAHTDDASSKRL